ncbi:hypothetical protein B1B_16575, partial [mine drainage metagenome]
MTERKTTLPEAIVEMQQQLEQYRTTRPARAKLPESLWQAAVELARHHGVYVVAHTLRLDYATLKQRLIASSASGASDASRQPAKAAFVELLGTTGP